MRYAQLVTSGIYLVFIGLATVLFHDGLGSDVTAIIELTQPVAVILPILIAVAAIGSQFSAAVADYEGAGGLLEEITHRKVHLQVSYGLILLITVTLTWSTNVNGIIAYASTAFTLFYFMQCLVAMIVAWKQKDSGSVARVGLFALLSILCLLVFALGISSE